MLVKIIFFQMTHLSLIISGEFIENQLPEKVTLQTFMEDLLKMPSQYIDQVMYSIKEQQQQHEHRPASMGTREQKREKSMEHRQDQSPEQQQQRTRSVLTSTTQTTTTSASHDS